MDISKVITENRGVLDSATLCGCSVGLSKNALDDQCVVDGHLHSDIEYMLKYDPDLLSQVKERVVNYAFDKSPCGVKHQSLLDLYSAMNDPEFDDVKNALSNISNDMVVNNLSDVKQ